jgi:hypothetical protein
MSRAFLLVLSVALAALVFAPVAAAQTDDRGMNDMGMNDMRMEDRGADDNMMSTPTASASMMSTASASSMSSPSANTTASATSGGKSKAAPTGHLPRTGGVSLAPLLAVGALSLLIGTGLLGAGLVRRSS